MDNYKYSLNNLDELVSNFQVDLQTGLSAEEVKLRQKTYGMNIVGQEKVNWLEILIRQFKSPFVYLLFFAAVVSFFLKDYVNTIIILSIVIINSILSFFQEYKAEQALTLLKKHLSISTAVLRDNKITLINSQDLVPGDIIYLNPGDYIPADVRFIKVENLFVDESILTGESATVLKIDKQLTELPDNFYKSTNLGFLGTSISQGTATAVVLSTGNNSMFGQIGQLTIETISYSSFEQRISDLSKFILYVIVITLIVLFASHLIIKWQNTDVIELLMFSIALTVGLIPEALPTVITFALSRGAVKLSQNHVIVKKLSAIEDLGSINLLCTDKTGTLTENKLALIDLYENESNLKLFSYLSSIKPHFYIDSFDKAILQKSATEFNEVKKEYELVKFIPFDPVRLRTGVILKHENKYLLIFRGAYEKLPSNVKIQSWIDIQAKDANRVIAIYYKFFDELPNQELDSNFTFSGLLSFSDPIKFDAKLAIEKANSLGIKIKMLTGDGLEVATSVANKIGMLKKEGHAMLGAEFEKLSLIEKIQIIKDYDIFARVTPEQKYEIVKLLSQDNVVGYLGDGINDAPALKAAHVGIVVKGSSDIAQDAADIVLLQKSLKVILDGIAIGRGVFANTIKYIISTLSSNFGNFYSIAIASLLIDFLPMLPIQILLLNLLSDLPMVSIATDRVDIQELKKPSSYSLKSIAFLATILGITSSVFDFIFFSIFYKSVPNILQTNWFIYSILTELVLVYSIRTKMPFFRGAFPSKILISMSMFAGFLAIYLPQTSMGQEFFHFFAPTKNMIFIILFLVLIYFITTELVKLLYYKKLNNR